MQIWNEALHAALVFKNALLSAMLRENAVKTIYVDQGIFKENVRYAVWTCRDPVSLILGTRF